MVTDTKVHIGLTDQQVDVNINPEELELLREGFLLITAEKELGFKQAMRSHWRSAIWSFALSWALVMEGYDSQLVSDRFIAKLGLEADIRLTAFWFLRSSLFLESVR